MFNYTLEQMDGHERPWQITRSSDGGLVYTMTLRDRSHAETILNNLNSIQSLSPEDTDKLLALSA